MPWASDGIAGYKAFGQWTAIVGTGRADGDVSIAAPSDQDRLAVGVALHRAAIGEHAERDSLRNVRSAQFLFFGHWNRKDLGTKLLSLPTAKLRELSRTVQRSDRTPRHEEV
jgi:hypothetical protein